MNLILMSDTHLLWDKPAARTDDAHATQLQKFIFVLDYAKKNNSTIVIAGDMFDKPRSWHLLPIITSLLKDYNVPIFLCWGQHDVYMYSELSKDKTNLGVLAKARLVTTLNEQPLQISKEPVFFYGCSYGQDVPEIRDKNKFNILVIHAGITDKALWSGQDYLDATKFLQQHDFDLIVCGDIHQKFCIGDKGGYICNSGPLLRKEASIYNFTHKPGFYTFNTESVSAPEFVEVPHRPAEEVLSRTHIEYAESAESALNEFVSSIEKSEVEDEDFRVNLMSFMKSNQLSKGVIELLTEVCNGVI